MAVAPFGDDVADESQGPTHGRTTAVLGVEPDRKLYDLLAEIIVLVVVTRVTFLDAKRIAFDFGDRVQGLAAKRPIEGGAYMPPPYPMTPISK